MSVFVCEWHLVAPQLERSDNGNAVRDQSLSQTLSFLRGDEIRQEDSLGILTFLILSAMVKITQLSTIV